MEMADDKFDDDILIELDREFDSPQPEPTSAQQSKEVAVPKPEPRNEDDPPSRGTTPDAEPGSHAQEDSKRATEQPLPDGEPAQEQSSVTETGKSEIPENGDAPSFPPGSFGVPTDSEEAQKLKARGHVPRMEAEGLSIFDPSARSDYLDGLDEEERTNYLEATERVERRVVAGEPTDDFITDYVEYADVLEAPADAHEWVAVGLVAATINGRVTIRSGGTKIPLDTWIALLSQSGSGRKTLVESCQLIVREAELDDLLQEVTWRSPQAFFQHIAEHPRGFFIWPEMSEVFSKLRDSKFAAVGAKQWLTDRFDNWTIPPSIKYRATGKPTDTPSIEFTEAPRHNLFATSSLDCFITSLSEEDTRGGFIPRWLLVRLPETDRVVPIPKPTNERLVRRLADCLSKARCADTSQVQGLYEEWYRKAKAQCSQRPNPGLAEVFFNRLRTHVWKLAVVFEVSQSCSLKVSPMAMQRAIKMAERIEEGIAGMLPSGMTREGHQVDKVQEYIRKGKADGRTSSEVARGFQGMNPKDRGNRLTTLVNGETVRRFSRPSKGRSSVVHVHQDFWNEHGEKYPNDVQL